MKNIIVCNTANDSISKIDLEKMNINTLPLKLGGERIGPRNIDIKEKRGVVANCYSDSITFIDLEKLKEKETYNVDKYPKDIKWRDKYIYIACGDSNSIVFFNEERREIDFRIKVGDYPSSIVVDKKEKNIYVASMNSNSINIIDIKSKKVIKEVYLEDTPTKILLSENEKKIYMCQNSSSENTKGYLRVYTLEDFKLIKEYNLGAFPSDILLQDGLAYTSNLGDGSISVLNLKDGNSYKIIVGGMPKSVLKIEENIIISDYYSGNIIFLNEISMKKKIIAVGNEPNAMITINPFR